MQHRYLTRLAAMLQNKMHVFVARYTVPLGDYITHFKSERAKIIRTPVLEPNSN